MTLRDVFCVAFGGAVGAILRYAVSLACEQWWGARFPWGTLIVNVVGCFLLGWLVQASHGWLSISEPLKLTLATGLLGALTTFSTFGVQTLQVWQRSAVLGGVNVLAHVLLGLLAAAVGMYLASRGQPPVT